MISRLLTLEYESEVCRYAFNLTSPADVSIINKHGGRNITYPRLAHIGGQADPWRPVTPLATLTEGEKDVLNSTSTASEPWIVIEGKEVRLKKRMSDSFAFALWFEMEELLLRRPETCTC